MTLAVSDLAQAIPLWSELDSAAGRLINYSENHTFLFDGPGGKFTLRVHRADYQNTASILSELAWLAALDRDTTLPIAHPVPGANGQMLQHFRTPSCEDRHAVLFHFIAGREPTLADDLTGIFRQLGATAATLHHQATTWQKPPGFIRQAWNAASILDVDGLWGNWRIAPGVTAGNREVIEQGTQKLRSDLAAYGMSPDRYGLIHADMRLGNLLIDGEKVSIIDFDDSGFCWFTYDFAASISFHETHPAIPALRQAWLDGYLPIRPLTDADIRSLDAMVLLRRMALLAWIGTHAETILAQTHMPGFAEGTADLVERYLATR